MLRIVFHQLEREDIGRQQTNKPHVHMPTGEGRSSRLLLSSVTLAHVMISGLRYTLRSFCLMRLESSQESVFEAQDVLLLILQGSGMRCPADFICSMVSF